MKKNTSKQNRVLETPEDSPMDNEYKFECYEQYIGDTDDVLKKIDDCQSCGSKLVFSHFPDYKNLLIQETARCLDCGSGNRKVIYVIN